MRAIYYGDSVTTDKPTLSVKVYRNLHKNLWSVRRGERVVDHTPHICLKDARFVVQPAGRERVRREGRKNVHAWVRGIVVDALTNAPLEEITYDPYKYDSFVTLRDGRRVERSDYVEMRVENGRCRVFALLT